ncbi:hypothetical protein CCP4SC76_1710012 [Gammaproteobacteria bacterium]
MALKLKKTAVEKYHSEHDKLKKYNILLVDDETTNVEVLGRILESEYHIVFANNGFAALEILKSSISTIHLIISDQRMPVMTGVEFLEKSISLSPATIRILLTGFADINSIIDSINRGSVYKFLLKPIDPTDLRISVQRAMEAYELREKNNNLIIELKNLNTSLEQKVHERTRELEELNRKLEALSMTDSLTKIANRRHFDYVLEVEWSRAKRTGQPLSLAMLDVDFFKKYNDHYGHQAGDECLRSVASLLNKCTRRAGDLAARYGGGRICIHFASNRW